MVWAGSVTGPNWGRQPHATTHAQHCNATIQSGQHQHWQPETTQSHDWLQRVWFEEKKATADIYHNTSLRHVMVHHHSHCCHRASTKRDSQLLQCLQRRCAAGMDGDDWSILTTHAQLWDILAQTRSWHRLILIWCVNKCAFETSRHCNWLNLSGQFLTPSLWLYSLVSRARTNVALCMVTTHQVWSCIVPWICAYWTNTHGVCQLGGKTYGTIFHKDGKGGTDLFHGSTPTTFYKTTI